MRSRPSRGSICSHGSLDAVAAPPEASTSRGPRGRSPPTSSNRRTEGTEPDQAYPDGSRSRPPVHARERERVFRMRQPPTNFDSIVEQAAFRFQKGIGKTISHRGSSPKSQGEGPSESRRYRESRIGTPDGPIVHDLTKICLERISNVTSVLRLESIPGRVGSLNR